MRFGTLRGNESYHRQRDQQSQGGSTLDNVSVVCNNKANQEKELVPQL